MERNMYILWIVYSLIVHVEVLSYGHEQVNVFSLLSSQNDPAQTRVVLGLIDPCELQPVINDRF